MDNIDAENLDFQLYDKLWESDTKLKLEEMGLPVHTLSSFSIYLKKLKVSGDNLPSLSRRKIEPSEREGVDEETKYRLSLLRP